MNHAKFLNIVGKIQPPDYKKYSYLIALTGEVIKTPLRELHKMDWAKATVLCKIEMLPKRNYSILSNGTIIEVVLDKDFDSSHVVANPWKKILERL